MKILTAGVDKTTLLFINSKGIDYEDIDIEDLDLKSWLIDEFYAGAVINIDKGPGVFCCRELRANKIDVPVIGLSEPNNNWSESRAIFLENGGDDLIRNPPNPREIVASLHAVVRRYKGSASSIVTLYYKDYVFKMDQIAARITVNGREIFVTSALASMLELLSTSHGKVVSKEQFMSYMYNNSNDEPEMKIIDVFICKLRNKFNEAYKGSGEFISTVWGRGYRLEGSVKPVFNDTVPEDAI